VSFLYDAQSILGPLVSEVEEGLADASTFQKRIQVATDFLLRRLDDQNPTRSVRRQPLAAGARSPSASIARRQRPGLASGNSSDGLLNRSASRPNDTWESSGLMQLSR
jgi:hypothetical protein